MTAIEIIGVGIIATAVADMWQQAVKWVTGIPAANWSLVGRWVAGFRDGKFYRPTIAADPRVPGESAVGWVFHYVVGIIYAAMFVAMGTALGGRFGLLEAGAFGFATLAAPWLLLKPALGLGLFAHRAVNQPRDLFVTTVTHLSFGVGLYVGASIVLAT